MRSHFSNSNVALSLALTVLLTCQLAACGTLLYPERRGQTEGRIDPGIAILDGVALLLFIIPGLIAFGIDFTTGAIYLPPGEANQQLREDNDTPMRVVYAPPDRRDTESIEAIVEANTGIADVMSSPHLRTRSFDSWSSFWIELDYAQKLIAAR